MKEGETNKRILMDCGVKEQNIELSKICTMCHTDLFYSHRVMGNEICAMLFTVPLQPACTAPIALFTVSKSNIGVQSAENAVNCIPIIFVINPSVFLIFFSLYTKCF